MAVLRQIAHGNALLPLNAATCGRQQSGNEPQQRGFAAAVRSGEHHKVVVEQFLADVTQNMAFAVAQANVRNMQYG